VCAKSGRTRKARLRLPRSNKRIPPAVPAPPQRQRRQRSRRRHPQHHQPLHRQLTGSTRTTSTPVRLPACSSDKPASDLVAPSTTHASTGRSISRRSCHHAPRRASALARLTLFQVRCTAAPGSLQAPHAAKATSLAPTSPSPCMLASSTCTSTAPMASTAPVYSSHGILSRSLLSLTTLVYFHRTSVSVLTSAHGHLARCDNRRRSNLSGCILVVVHLASRFVHRCAALWSRGSLQASQATLSPPAAPPAPSIGPVRSNVSVSAYQRISVSAYQRISVSAYQRISVSAYQRISVSAYQRIRVSPCPGHPASNRAAPFSSAPDRAAVRCRSRSRMLAIMRAPLRPQLTIWCGYSRSRFRVRVTLTLGVIFAYTSTT
jgi:hypothetical protein